MNLRMGLVTSSVILMLAACHGQHDIDEPGGPGSSQGSPGDIGGPEPSYTCSGAPAKLCSAMESELRTMMLKDMNERMDQIRELLLSLYTISSSGGFISSMLNTDTDGTPSTIPPGGDTAQQFSRTNNQISGVNEADLVKTDGKYLYVASGSTLKIIRAYPPAQSSLTSSTSLTGEAHSLLVRGDRVAVFSLVTVTPASKPTKLSQQELLNYYLLGSRWCGKSSGLKHTIISVFDVSDRNSPRLLRELRVAGELAGARRVGEAVHTILRSPDPVACKLRYFPPVDALETILQKQDKPDSAAVANALDAALNVLRAENAKVINKMPFSQWLPSAVETAAASGKQTDVPRRCAPVVGSPDIADSWLTTALSFDLSTLAPASAMVISTPPGVIYATANSLYLASNEENCMRQFIRSYLSQKTSTTKESTSVVRLCLSNSPPGAAFEALGKVEGTVINQFALDEYKDHLRIATSANNCFGSKATNTMSVLKREGSALKVVGKVGDLAKNETIRSVRFQGSRGYMVTFRRTDPLFVFDLADAKNPRVLSELKVSGYSTYIHSMDSDHLLTLGYEADTSTGQVEGMKLQIFDVTDMKNPSLAHQALIGSATTTSEALKNHLAVTYFAPMDLLAFPVELKAYGGNLSKLMLYKVTKKDGFTQLGQVQHSASQSGAADKILRSMVMDQYLLTLSKQRLKVSGLGDPLQDIKEIILNP